MKNNLTKMDIKNKIENLEKYFSKYKNQGASKKLEEIKQKLDNQEYKIAVVANMSSGKSTFINALFGKEVLPAFNHATTDSATFIYSKPNIGKKAEVFFSDGRNSITVKEDLEKEIKQYAQKDEDCKDDKYKNVDKIDLYYPFKNLQTTSSEDFSITFIDTPGPNSTGDYGQKHKDQTRSVLNSVDMALFAFDYGQLDANLKSDEQGLWNTIKTRYEKDPNFEVYFLINKIDMAMEDNFKDVKSIDEAKKNWGTHEEKAVEKLIKAAKNYGVNEPKVYTVASKFALLDRDDISWDSPLESFQKKFKQIFESSWESEYIKYLGIVELENDINNYINTSVKEKILKIAFDNIVDVSNDELSTLNTSIQTLSKPKEEATKNVNKALDFLNGEAKELEKDMNDSFNKSSKKAIEETDNLIDTTIEDELTSKIDEMSKIAIAYAEAIAEGENPNNAKKAAKQFFKKVNLDKEVILELEDSIDMQQVLVEMQKYTKVLFEDYKNNYLDVKTDLKECFGNYERDISKIFRQVKENLSSQLQNALDIEMQSLEIQTVDIDSNLSFEVSIPDSVLDYKYQEAEYRTVGDSTWYKPWTWGKTRREKVENEKHTLIINPQDLNKSIEKSMNDTIEIFVGQEKENYKNAIIELRRNNSGIFQDFRLNKQKEIDKLQDDIKDSEKNLKVVERQLEDFNNLTKE
ncbi:dynamin family protein [Aliarcobacter cryaerophilus]|uniref:dynamin family protein n=1 Tax=Aliarcobacter cryaerophilus TaxID=28198 RepID=UPI00083266C5|nr:dynamin family protein [Aliarcobacter cryaerophilus]